MTLAGSSNEGFCRDLHDESVEALCAPMHMPTSAIADTARNSLRRGRKLDAGNAGPGNIGNDWTILGMALWDDLKAAYPGQEGASDWSKRLEWLNLARNGIAHNDEDKIAKAHTEHPLTVRTFRVTRGRLTTTASQQSS